MSATPSDPFELLKSFWSSFGMPPGGMGAGLGGAMGAGMPNMASAMPAMDPAEIAKRIADLRSVENWLNMNLSMLRMHVQALEMQQAAMSAMQGMGDAFKAGAAQAAANMQAAADPGDKPKK
jgi:hypothetical protein